MKFNELDKSKLYKCSHWTNPDWVICYSDEISDWVYLNGEHIGVAVRDADNLAECDENGKFLLVNIDTKPIFDTSDIHYYECVFNLQDLNSNSVKKYIYKSPIKLNPSDKVLVESFDNKENVAYIYQNIEPHDIILPLDSIKWITSKTVSLEMKSEPKQVNLDNLIQNIIK